jgi:L-2-hydroxyglutarate oxidase LhgO
MSTRSTTVFISRFRDNGTNVVKDTKVCKIYRQMDGYPEGHGMDMAGFLNTGELVNGIGLGADKRQFNGMGCLAASVIAHLKKGSGGIYMIPVSQGGQEYNYKVIAD